MKFKKILKTSLLFICIVIVSFLNVNVLAESFPLYLNNQKLELSDDVFIENGNVMVPLRKICEYLEYKVNWNNLERQIEISKIGQISWFLFEIDSPKVGTIHGQKIIDISPKIVKDRTYLPLNILAEILGDNILWDDNSKSIHISKNPKYTGVESYNLEDSKIEVEFNSSGYLPQIVNPSDKEQKINESILSRLNDYIEPIIINFTDGSGNKTEIENNTIFENIYKYEIRNNKNNIFSISCDRVTIFSALGLPHKPTRASSFCNTFYKDTGEKLQIEDILKGTKEDIENIIISAYGNEVGFTEICNWNIPKRHLFIKKIISLDDAIENKLLDNYDFYIEENDLVFTLVIDGDIGEFKLNIPNNASLFQEDFLKNFNLS